ncbi:MAG: glutamate-5-semialdehyde dehydrogenase [Chloroflexota bacterium]|nr:glutamate-5-semialdehyde dehydrogenase [Chloroflexota bacterium]
MTTITSELQAKGAAARQAARQLARLSTEVKNRALLAIAEALDARQEEILAANREDHQAAQVSGLSPAVVDRLLLNPERLSAVAKDVRTVALLPDPVGEVIDMRTLPNGLVAGRRRVPLGVIAAIYESRPNVTVDIASLCLKSGNACILRGGKEVIRSNTVLARVMREAVVAAGVPEGAVQLIENTDRALVGEMLKMRDVIDLVVPRGGGELVRFVAENARMPVLVGGIGVCHTYVDRAADIDMAVRVVHNAKCRRCSICNALDTLLVHADIAEAFLPAIARVWAEAGVEMRCDPRALRVLQEQGTRNKEQGTGNKEQGTRNKEQQGGLGSLKLVPCSDVDFDTEFLALVAAVRVVDSLDDALDHIERHGTGHSDAIISEDYSAARRFVDEVDTAVVYVNASTQFTDGAQFGLGAEIIDSTQKTIARGPVGLREITTYKWIVLGSGQTRP